MKKITNFIFLILVITSGVIYFYNGISNIFSIEGLGSIIIGILFVIKPIMFLHEYGNILQENEQLKAYQNLLNTRRNDNIYNKKSNYKRNENT